MGWPVIRALLAWVGGAMFAVGFLNAVAYTVHAEVLGGGSVYEHGGRYYVNSHGNHTEVSAEQAERIAWHQRCSGATTVAGFLGVLLAMPAILAQRNDAVPERKVLTGGEGAT